MRTRVIEIIKTILIVLLALLVVVQTLLAYSGSSLAGAGTLHALLQSLRAHTQDYRLQYAAESSTSQVAAGPLAVSVCNPMGRASVLCDFNALDSAYDTLGGLLGEALESAKEVKSVSQLQFLAALTRPGVYFGYAGSLPASLLASWLAVQTGLEADCCALALSVYNAQVYLFCRTPDGYLRAATDLPPERLEASLRDWRPDGSAFACELEDEVFARLSGESLLRMDSVSLPEVAVSIPVSHAEIQTFATQCGFNPYSNSEYTASDGAVVYEESAHSLSVWPDGRLELRNSSTSNALFQASGKDDASLVEFARELLETLCGSLRGDARLYLTAISRSGSEVSVTFEYFLAGVQIELGSGSAAVLTFRDSSLTSLRLQLRSYHTTGGTLSLLPERQATAIVSEGALLRPRYADTGESLLRAGWIKE